MVVVLAVVLGVAAVATSGRWLFRPLQRGDWVQPYPGAYFGGKGTFYKPKGPDKFKGMFTQTASLSAIANSGEPLLPRICARAWMDAVAARCCPLLPSADVRAAGDVIALQGVYARRANTALCCRRSGPARTRRSAVERGQKIILLCFFHHTRICSRTLMGCAPSVFLSVGGSLLPSICADARYIDAVVAFRGGQSRRSHRKSCRQPGLSTLRHTETMPKLWRCCLSTRRT